MIAARTEVYYRKNPFYMKLTVEELEGNRYHLKDKFAYSELPAFIQRYLSKVNAATVIFFIISITSFAILVFHVIVAVKSKGHGLANTSAFLGGLVLLLLLIPIHEIIHAIAYKLFGAHKVSFDINLKKFMFLTVADRFVADKQEFITILLAPCIVISIALTITYFFSGPYLKCSLAMAFACHTFACSGDFGLASYFLFHKNEQVVTYDDNQEKACYFFEKTNSVRGVSLKTDDSLGTSDPIS